jgi:membrane dipeptidase
MLFAPSWLDAAADAPDPRVAQVMSKTIGIDMHNHVYPPGTEPHPQHGPQGAPQGGPQGGPPPPQEQQPSGPELSIANEIKISGLTAVCASYVLDFAQNNKPGDAMQNFLSWLTAIDAELAKGHMHRALNLKDLQTAHAQNQPTIVQTVEGSQFIEGQLDRIETVYKRGVRHLQLLHSRDDKVSPLADVLGSAPHLGGLTAFGAEVIKTCNRLGILVDLAHATPEAVLAALKVATQPLIYSHTGLDTRLGKNPGMVGGMKTLLISKEHAKVIADAGGVVGVWTKLADSPKEFVENLKAMADAIGIDHVGIGTDSDLLSSRPGQGTGKQWPGVTTGFFNATVAAMLSGGFTTEEISKVGGGNYCRVFGKATRS